MTLPDDVGDSFSLDREPPPKDEELARLIRAVSNAERFALYFVRADSPVLAGATVDELASQSGLDCRKVEMPNDAEDLASVLHQAGPFFPSAVVCMLGFDGIFARPDHGRKFFAAVNFQRDTLSRVHAGPLVLFLPAFGVKAVKEMAPDFASVVSSFFWFGRRQPETPVGFDARLAKNETWNALAEMEPAERKDRIATWQELVDGVAQSERGSSRAGEWLAALGVALGADGQLARARRCLEDAIAIAEKTLPAGHPILAVRYSDLATILDDLGDYPEARRRIEQAIAIDERHLPAGHPTLAVRYSNLAVILSNLGDQPEARRRAEQAVAIAEKHLPADHPILAVHHSNLATTLRHLGEFPEARRHFEQAVAIGEKRYPGGHPDLATSYSNLALILGELGNFAEAKQRIVQAIAMDLNHLPDNHPAFAIRYYNLAYLLTAQGDLSAARMALTRADTIARQHFKPDHPLRRAIAQVQARLGRKGVRT